jgi:hypothetical protein
MKLDFVGVGPQRSGTSWLHSNLVDHPDVLLPRPPIKETFYFDRYYERGPGWYRDHFEAGPREGVKVGEFGPSYFDVPEVPDRIAAAGAERIIISVRDPVERAFSLFIHHASRARVPLDFDEAVRVMPQILTSGHYAIHTPRWLERFERVHFLLLEDVATQPVQVLGALYEFLGVRQIAHQAPTPASNTARLPRFPRLERIRRSLHRFARERHLYPMLATGRALSRRLRAVVRTDKPAGERPRLAPAQRAWLREYYSEDVAYLEELLHRSLRHWDVPTHG